MLCTPISSRSTNLHCAKASDKAILADAVGCHAWAADRGGLPYELQALRKKITAEINPIFLVSIEISLLTVVVVP